jgi:hypothetical protein
MTEGNDTHEFPVAIRDTKYLVDLYLVFIDLPEPDTTKLEGMDGKQHVLEKRPDPLHVLHVAIFLGRVEKDRKDTRRARDEAAITRAFREPLPGVQPGDDQHPPWLVIQARRRPPTTFDDLHDDFLGHGLARELPHAAPRLQAFDGIHVIKEATACFEPFVENERQDENARGRFGLT